jgi:hypothetical protein
MSAARNARRKTLRALGKVSPDYLFAALREHDLTEAARRSLSPADFAARNLLKAIELAQGQQRQLEECGADPVKTGCFDECGAPAAATDSVGRLICVTGERLGLPVWFYASRAEGLTTLLKPAVEALNTATLGKPKLFAPGALAAMRRAIEDCETRDKAATLGRVEL